MKAQNKLALVLHGYPRPVSETSRLITLMKQAGYNVVAPWYLKECREFSVPEVKKLVREKLKNKKPDLIIGLSLGGMLLPHIARDYPKAKVVFLGTGPMLSGRIKWMDNLVKLAAGRVGETAVKTLARLPEKVLKQGYMAVHKIRREKTDSENYIHETEQTVKFFREINVQKHLQTARFIKRCNNCALLQKLPNKTLIISGKNDVLMPPELGRLIQKLVKHSRLVLTSGTHYQLMDGTAYNELSRWLG